MSRPSDSAPLTQLLKAIPPRWAMALLAGLVGYALLQPVANRTLGWKLPPLVGGSAEEAGVEATIHAPRPAETEATAQGPAVPKEPPQRPPRPPVVSDGEVDANLPPKGTSLLRYGLLEEVARDQYRSPAGLIYGRGSEEGHRLKHLERHLKDQPNRPGSHGVFEGDMPQVLRWIDEAYVRAIKKDRQASVEEEGDRTVYEYTFSQPIGFIGGASGKQRGHPTARRIRIVVSGQQVITAFPF